MNMRFKSFFVTVIVMIFSCNLMAFAATEPVVNAEGALLMEATTGKVLFEKNSNQKLYPASMTKIMTAMVALDHFTPDALITVGTEINEITNDSSKAGHTRGETLTVENLIRGLIIPSGNDSANVLAVAVARKVNNDENLSYDSCIQVFTNLMNEKAKELGATNTQFTNAHGYHDENHYSSAHDMGLFAQAAMKNETIKKIAAEKSFSGNGAGNTLETDSSIKTRDYEWLSHNLLLTNGDYYYEYANGLKTGFTNEAGSCITATAEKDGKQLIAVIFNSEDPNRWTDAITLFEYGFSNFSYVDIQKDGDVIENVSLSGHNRLNGDNLDVIVKEDIKDFLSNDQFSNIKKTIKYKEELIAENKNKEDTTIYLKAPLEKDSEVGTISYSIDGQVLHESKLYAGANIEKSTILSSLQFFFKDTFSKLFTTKGILTFVGILLGVVILIFLIRMILRRRGHSRYKYKYKVPKSRKRKFK